jgi:hypothetical protein
VTRADQLATYLAREGGRPHQWGAADCARFAAGWVCALTGTEPGLAASYGDEAGARRLLAAEGGYEALADRYLAGLARRGPGDDVAAGDIGLIRLGGHPAFAILTPGRAFLRSSEGLVTLLRFHILCLWRVP